MRVLIGADATRAIETSSDEFRTLVLGAIFSDVVTGSAFADNLDLLEDAIEDPRNEKLKGFSQQGLVKEMRKVVKDVDKQPIGRLLRGQKFYKKFDIGSDDELEKPFEELTLDEILDDEKIKRLLGFRQMQRPPEIEAGTNGFITSSYLRDAIKIKRGFAVGQGITEGETFELELSESQTSDISGSKVDYLQKEGYSPYLTPVKISKMNLYNESRDKIKDDSLYSKAKEMLKEEFKDNEVMDFLKVSKVKENEKFDEYSVRIKNSVKKQVYNFLISNVVKGEVLLDIFYSRKEKVTERSKSFEGMNIIEIIDNPDKFIQKVYPTDYNLYDMTLEIESKKTVFSVKLVGEKTHGLFETGLVQGEGTDTDSSSYKPITASRGRSLPLGTQRKGSDYRRKLRDFAAVIRNNYLELMEV